MTTQARFTSGGVTFDLLSNGWHIPTLFVPPTMNLTPLIASGVPSADYAGGELVDELQSDVTFTLPLLYKGSKLGAARRALESFLRLGVAMRDLQLQLREDRGFSITPLWGQWGTWLTYEVIHAGSLQFDERIWEVNDGVYANLGLTCQPAIGGQVQAVAKATGDISEDVGSDGLSRGVILAQDDASSIAAPYDIIDGKNGTIIVAWEAGATPASSTGDYLIFSQYDLAVGLSLYWDSSSSGRWRLTDGVGTINYAGTYPTQGDLVIFHITFENSTPEMVLYINGQEVVSGTFDDYSPSTGFFIGSDVNGERQIGGLFRLFCTYNTYMKDTEVAADYTELVNALSAGPSPSPIPYLWTPNGDNLFDNCLDTAGSTGAPHTNYGSIAGIAGSLPAKLFIDFYFDQLFSDMQRVFLSLCHLPLDESVAAGETLDPNGALVNGDEGATLSTSSWAGDFNTVSLSTTDVSQLTTLSDYFPLLTGQKLTGFFRARNGSGSASIYARAEIVYGGQAISTRTLTLSTVAGFRLYRFPTLPVPAENDALAILDETVVNTRSAQITFSRPSGTADFYADAVVFMPGKIAEFTAPKGATSGDYLTIYDDEAMIGISGVPDRISYGYAVRRGDVLRPFPHRQNLIMALMGDSTVDPLISWTALAQQVEIVPRWSVL